MTAAPEVREKIDIPALAPERREAGDRRLRTGENDEHRLGGQGLAAFDHDNADLTLQIKRIEIVEIGDARQDRNRDRDRPPARPWGAKPERILLRQSRRIRAKTNKPKARPTGQLLDPSHAARKKNRIATKRVEEKPRDQFSVGRIEHGLGANDL